MFLRVFKRFYPLFEIFDPEYEDVTGVTSLVLHSVTGVTLGGQISTQGCLLIRRRKSGGGLLLGPRALIRKSIFSQGDHFQTYTLNKKNQFCPIFPA